MQLVCLLLTYRGGSRGGGGGNELRPDFSPCYRQKIDPGVDFVTKMSAIQYTSMYVKIISKERRCTKTLSEETISVVNSSTEGSILEGENTVGRDDFGK